MRPLGRGGLGAVYEAMHLSWQRISTDEMQRPSTTGIAAPMPDTLVRHLAFFIGPIAKVVLNRLAKQTTNYVD